MHKGASQQLTEKHRGARRGRTGPKWAWAGRPGRPAHPDPSPVRVPLLPYVPHPSIHQRAAEMKEKHREEDDSRRESSSCLGDGLGHALATMVGPAW
jgi:hypothetical protein